MENRKLFGTDGIRGKANIFPMTGEVAMALGRAVTHYFQSSDTNNSKPLIIVGKDTRLSCYMLEQAFSAGVCSQGGEVVLTGPLPTPGIAFVTKSMRADAGIMISASHNQYDDNGIKIFDNYGHKLPDVAELEIEKLVLNPELMPTPVDDKLGNAKRLKEVFGRYIVHVKASVSDSVDLEGMKVVLDCANGAAYKVAPMMFQELGAEVITHGVTPNGLNINDKCGSMYPEAAAKKVLKHKADIGICLDGDADRLIVIDQNAQIVDGDKIIGLFAKLLLDQGRLKKGDTVVGTVMSNLGLERSIEEMGLKFHRTNVGDRYIIEYMKEHGAILGGEPSGHIIFTEHTTTGDGSLAALKLIECMNFYNKSLDVLTEPFQMYPNVLINIKVKNKKPFEEIEKLSLELNKVKNSLGDKGRTLIRYSGTENLARVMVEGESLEVVTRACETLAQIIKDEIGS